MKRFVGGRALALGLVAAVMVPMASAGGTIQFHGAVVEPTCDYQLHAAPNAASADAQMQRVMGACKQHQADAPAVKVERYNYTREPVQQGQGAKGDVALYVVRYE